MWDPAAYDFVTEAETEGRAPGTVDPSLWRQARLLSRQGLYRVTERIYQVRGLDLSNMTIVEGRHRRHRDRPADLRRDRRRGDRALPRAPRATGRSGR
ncbi:hypothetical protein Shyd_84050 [Streptomyces hydrogenans]|uniref:Uncharacterized protein n=1 Tax=Streptomyces hydrogenans TaxID=1873719 RepID=A0ABQ3PPU6_9ACTN|nr:hypothetical protein Shyd_84050 [Streptomyces hydrogenans]